MKWTCPWCLRVIETRSGLIENAVRKHLESHGDVNKEARERALRKLRERVFRERLRRVRRKYLKHF